MSEFCRKGRWMFTRYFVIKITHLILITYKCYLTLKTPNFPHLQSSAAQIVGWWQGLIREHAFFAVLKYSTIALSLQQLVVALIVRAHAGNICAMLWGFFVYSQHRAGGMKCREQTLKRHHKKLGGKERRRETDERKQPSLKAKTRKYDEPY